MTQPDRHLVGGLRGARLGERVIHERLWHKAPMAQNQNEGERIAKVIARAGSHPPRGGGEAWIAAGRVSVNGAKITFAGAQRHARRQDRGRRQAAARRGAHAAVPYHKPRGLVTTTSDPQGRPTIFGALPKDLPRLISIGRLDLSTEGLLLLTNDGGLARALELPSTAWLRRYRVRAHGKVTQADLDALRDGVTSTASITGRSKRCSTASRPRTCGSRSASARARTARCAMCCAISGCRSRA
jgi:16S rRNA U516 pseudouridylate synthase RsuA-like enzyme